MKEKDLPLGFLSVLAQDKRAMQTFAHMGDREQAFVLSRARRAVFLSDMQVIVSSLDDRTDATEEY